MNLKPFLAPVLLLASLANAGQPARLPPPAATPAIAAHAVTDMIGDVDVRALSILAVARLVSDLSRVNIVTTTKASEQTVTLFLRGTTVKNLIDAVCRVSGLWYRFDAASNTYLIMTAQEFQRDVVVFRADHTRVLTLKHHNVVSAANAIRALYGSRVTLTEPVEEGLSIAAVGSPLSSQRTATGSATAGQASARGAGPAGQTASGSGAAGAPASARDAAALSNLSLGSLRSVASAVDGAQTRIAGGELEKLDQTHEPPINVTFNRLHNFLLLRAGDEQVLNEIEALVTRLDQPARQVLLEMKVLELVKDDDFASAFDLDFTHGSDIGNGAAAARLSGSVNPNTATRAGTTTLFQFMNQRIRARLQLLQSENRVNVLATPMLLASNNQPSRLFIGEERVLTTGASATQTTNQTNTSTLITVQTEKRNVGNTLIIVPRINADRSISLSIDQDSSEVLAGGGTVPVGVGSQLLQVPVDVVSTANLQSTVLAKDGLTVAIGGMIRVSKNRRVDKVPLLGDMPGLGVFFRTEADNKDKSEVVLLVTPYILDSPEEAQLRSRERLGDLLSDPATDLPRLMPQSKAASTRQAPADATPTTPTAPPIHP